MIKLHQAFYGRDPLKGYRLLASSDSVHNATVERLCSGIGTPDGISDMKPFYIQYVDGIWRYMIYCCVGNPDDAGRKTLFFHTLIGNHWELQSANIGIGALIHEHLFQASFKDGPVLPVSVDCGAYSLPWGRTSISPMGNEKFAIFSNKPDLDLVTGTLKGAIDKTSWASFTFLPLPDFQMYVLSEYAVSKPNDRKCFTSDGTVLPMKQRPQVKDDNTSTTTHSENPDQKSVGKLFFAFVVGIACGVLLYWLFSTPEVKFVEKEKIVYIEKEPATNPVPPEIKVEKIVEEKIVEKIVKKDNTQAFKDEFQKMIGQSNKYKFNEWQKELKKDPRYDEYETSESGAMPLIRYAAKCVRFCERFLEEEKKNIEEKKSSTKNK